jgi:uncharacterized coiled-coil DUF342 family protein
MKLQERISEYQSMAIRIKAQMHDLTDQLIGINNKIIAFQEVMQDVSENERAAKQAVEEELARQTKEEGA